MSREQRRVKIVTLRDEGFSVKEIAERTGADRRTVQRVCKRVKETGTFKEKHRSGRPALLDARKRRIIARILQRIDTKNAEAVRKEAKTHHNIEVSRDTISRALKTMGYIARVKFKKPRLTVKQKKARLNWARKYASWTSDDWRKVIWSDESKFTLVNSEGKEYVWVKQTDSLRDDEVIGTKKFGGGKVMLWGCMTWEGVGLCCKIDTTMDAELYSKILKEELMNTIHYYNLDQSEVIFQHDNDPKHTSHLASDTLEELGIDVMSWPAQSPDLNPIEHLWDHLQRQIRNHSRIFGSIEELWEKLEQILIEENKEFCRKLISSLPERVNDVIKAKGGYTRW